MARIARKRTAFDVSQVVFDGASQFVTIGPEDPAWASLETADLPDAAFVRLKPPETATDEQVAALRNALRKRGAVVRVMPRPRRAILPVSKSTTMVKASVRDVVLKLVSDARCRRPEALSQLVESVLSEVGL